MTNKRRPYPAKHRKKMAENAKKNKPWAHSTGPKTEAGKARVTQNATKHGYYSEEMKEIRALLRLQKAFVKKAMT